MLSTPGQSPVETFLFPDYLSNPHLRAASLRPPRVSRTPTRAQDTVPRHRAPVRRLNDPSILHGRPDTGRCRTDGPPHTGVGLVRARQEIIGVRASPMTGRRDGRARKPRLDGDALPAPTRLRRGKCRGVDREGAAKHRSARVLAIPLGT